MDVVKQEKQLRFIDAVMGTGKSSYIIQKIKSDTESKYLVVLPWKSEITRFKDELDSFRGVFVPEEMADDQRISKSVQMSRAFRRGDTDVFLCTHKLFLEFLQVHKDLSDIKLIIDEVPMTFDPDAKGTGWAGKEGLLSVGAIEKVQLRESLYEYKIIDSWDVNNSENPLVEAGDLAQEFYRTLQSRDCIQYGNSSAVFSLRADRILQFKEATILGYLWEDTDLFHWTNWKDISVDHLELFNDNTIENPVYRLEEHSGVYSGVMFKDNITVLREKTTHRGLLKGGTHSWYARNVKEPKLNKATGKTGITDNHKHLIWGLARESRSKQSNGNYAKGNDFMLICPKGALPFLVDGKRGLGKNFIEDNWVPWNIKGTNDYAHIHNVAYCLNLKLFANVNRVVQKLPDTTYSKVRHEDIWALSAMIQAIWRSAIRRCEKIRVYIPNKRMADLFENWLNTEVTENEKVKRATL